MALRVVLPILESLATREGRARLPIHRDDVVPVIDGRGGALGASRAPGVPPTPGGRRDGVERTSDRGPRSTAARTELRMARRTTTEEVASKATPTGGSLVFAGCVAGMAGGVAMAAYLMLSAVVQGMEPLAALEPMGATFRDAEALDGGLGPVLYGVSLHLGVSALVGLLFAIVLPRDLSPGSAGFVCVAFAFVVMGFMTSVVVPAVNPVLKESLQGLGGSWVIAHALFGVTVGFACQRLRQGFAARAERHLRHRTV